MKNEMKYDNLDVYGNFAPKVMKTVPIPLVNNNLDGKPSYASGTKVIEIIGINNPPKEVEKVVEVINP